MGVLSAGAAGGDVAHPAEGGAPGEGVAGGRPTAPCLPHPKLQVSLVADHQAKEQKP